MRVYKCKIEYEKTEISLYSDDIFDKDIYIKAKSVLEAYQKALHYREKGEVKKVIEVWSVEFVLTIDKE